MKDFFIRLERLFNLPECKNPEYIRKTITPKTRKEVYSLYKGLCYLCKAKTSKPLTHHVLPAGESDLKNLVLLCPACHEFVHINLHAHLGYKKHARRGAFSR